MFPPPAPERPRPAFSSWSISATTSPSAQHEEWPQRDHAQPSETAAVKAHLSGHGTPPLSGRLRVTGPAGRPPGSVIPSGSAAPGQEPFHQFGGPARMAALARFDALTRRGGLAGFTGPAGLRAPAAYTAALAHKPPRAGPYP